MINLTQQWTQRTCINIIVLFSNQSPQISAGRIKFMFMIAWNFFCFRTQNVFCCVEVGTWIVMINSRAHYLALILFYWNRKVQGTTAYMYSTGFMGHTQLPDCKRQETRLSLHNILVLVVFRTAKPTYFIDYVTNKLLVYLAVHNSSIPADFFTYICCTIVHWCF